MNKNFLKFRWVLLITVFLIGQFFFNPPAHAEWTVVDSPVVSSDWELFNIRFSWAVGQDLENRTGVLLYFHNGSWIPATLPAVSSDWALSGVDLTTPTNGKGWAVGQDFENKRGVLVYFMNPVVANLPTVTTTSVTNITETTATGGGNITSDGGTQVTARGVCWSLSADPDAGDTCTNDGTGTGIFTSSLTGLTPDTLYHVRAYATNSVGTAYGNDLTFTTKASLLPTVTTAAPSNINPTTATGGGNVTSAGGAAVTARGVCWSTLGSPVVGGTCTSDGTGTGVFTSSITGLTPDTLYHVRAYATNSLGTGYGADVTFSTSPLVATASAVISIPNATTAAASSGGDLIWPLGTVIPPNISSDWGLSAVTFISSDFGWAVGQDFENGKGVILLYSEGAWISVTPPFVSSDWGLSSVHFSWAVGQDWENGRGVILYFSGSSWTSIVPPEVSSNWGLSSVHYLSPKEAWAVGQDWENMRGVILHFLNGSWTSVNPPDVSSEWGLTSIDFISPNEAWAVGEDLENGTAALLHYFNGSWTSVSPPDIGLAWGLSGIHLMSATQGWAVGQASDGSGSKGLLLKYTVPKISVSPTNIEYYDVEIGALLEKTVTVKNIGNGDLLIDTVTPPSPPFSISTDSCSGRSLAWSQSCKITYRFLPDSPGIFWSNSNILSNGSAETPVTVTLTGFGKAGTSNYIRLLGPSSDSTFTACDYPNPPVFEWESDGSFTGVEVQFSLQEDFSKIPFKLRGTPGINQIVIRPAIWKRILLLPGNTEGTIYWRVVAKKKDKTRVESDVFSLLVGATGPVLNPEMSHTSKTLTPPPTLWWENNCNVSFNVWFGNHPDLKNRYTNKTLITSKIKSLDEIQDMSAKELSPGQWQSIRKLGGNITGATLYWYIQSVDTLGRRQSTEVMSFVLTD